MGGKTRIKYKKEKKCARAQVHLCTPIFSRTEDFHPLFFEIFLFPFFSNMGNNLNQIAKQLNSAAKAGVIENMQVIRAITEVAAAERSLNALREYLAGREGAEK